MLKAIEMPSDERIITRIKCLRRFLSKSKYTHTLTTSNMLVLSHGDER